MASKGIILLIEDNEKLNDANSRAIKLRGYETLTAAALAEAREILSLSEPDVILLDVMLPDGDGFDFCEEIRGKTKAHILFLTAKTEHADKVRGLTAGGDDYIMKPFHPEELLARIASVMRRRAMDNQSVKTLSIGNLALDIVAAQAFVNGADLVLSQREFALLLLFAQNENETMSAETLYEKAWGTTMANDKNTLQATISKLRKKIKSSGYDVVAFRGQGYVFGQN